MVIFHSYVSLPEGIKFPAYDLHGIVGETTKISMSVPLSQIFPDQQFLMASRHEYQQKSTLTKISPRKIADNLHQANQPNSSSLSH